MDLFSIVCNSCATRLKVSKVSSIGQRLGCPKCGSMLDVQPPADWVAPPEVAAELEKSVTQNTIEDADFGDIDSILSASDNPTPKNPQSGAPDVPKPNRTPKRNPGNSQQPQSVSHSKPISQKQPPASRSADPKATTADPFLPDGNWVSADSKKKQKLTLIVSAIVGATLLVGTVVTAIVLNRPDEAPVVIKQADDSENDEAEDKPLLESDNESPEPAVNNPEDKVNDPVIGNPPSNDPEEPISEPATETPLGQTADAQSRIEPETSENQSQETDSTSGNINQTDIGAPTKLDQNPLNQNPMAKSAEKRSDDDQNDSLVKRDIFGDVQAEETEFDKLAGVLQQSGTSLLSLRDEAVASRERESIGISKYFVERPEPENINLERNLNTSLNGIIYKDVELLKMLRELSRVTSVPFQIDVDSLQSSGIVLNPIVSVSINEPTTFAEAVNHTVKPMGLISVVGDSAVVIKALNSLKLVEEAFELPKLDDPAPEKYKNFISFIRESIDPESWTRENDPPTILLEENQITVRQTVAANIRIQELVEKISAARVVMKNPADADRLETLKTRSQIIEPVFRRPIEIKKTPMVQLEVLLDRIQETSGLTIMVDWAAISKEGWNIRTLVPGDIDETTVGKYIRELARGMEIAIRAIDEKTILLTTFDAAAQHNELEVYPSVGVMTRLDGDQLFRVLRVTLGGEIKSLPNVNIRYEPEFKCLIVFAPQSLQRQIDSVLAQLRSIK